MSSLQSCVWCPWQVFCEDPSLTLITNSHQRLLSRAVVSKEIDVQIEDLYCVGSVLVSRKYNRNPISLALEFDTRQWAWYLDSVHRGPHNITVSSHSHISHDDPAQKSGQVGHQHPQFMSPDPREVGMLDNHQRVWGTCTFSTGDSSWML